MHAGVVVGQALSRDMVPSGGLPGWSGWPIGHACMHNWHMVPSGGGPGRSGWPSWPGWSGRSGWPSWSGRSGRSGLHLTDMSHNTYIRVS